MLIQSFKEKISTILFSISSSIEGVFIFLSKKSQESFSITGKVLIVLFFFCFISLLFFLFFIIKSHFYQKKIITLEKENESILLELNNSLKQSNLLQNSINFLEDKFKFISSETVNKQTGQFIKITNELIDRLQKESKVQKNDHEEKVEKLLNPLQTLIQHVEASISNIEKNNGTDRTILKQQIESVVTVAQNIQYETSKVINSLRSPNVRGLWGEMQLKRLVELAGMQEYCDFESQKDMKGAKPDMIIHIPNGGTIIIDSKVPLVAYMNAVESIDEKEKKLKFQEHAKHLKNHINLLFQKKYWEYFTDSPEFVILFLPGECFLSAALEAAPGLLEYSFSQKIVIATPTTLMTLLRTVAYGWKNLNISKDIDKIKNKLFSLTNILNEFSEKISSVGKCIDKSKKEFLSLESFSRDKIINEVENFSNLYKPSVSLVSSMSEKNDIITSKDVSEQIDEEND
jgi:DNA recombination protein RmuC